MRNLSSRDWGDREARGQKVWLQHLRKSCEPIFKGHDKEQYKVPLGTYHLFCINVVIFQRVLKFNTYKFTILRGERSEGEINLSKWRDLEKISSFPVWLNTEGKALAASKYFPVPSIRSGCWAYQQTEQSEDSSAWRCDPLILETVHMDLGAVAAAVIYLPALVLWWGSLSF